jgi:integrase
VVLSQRDVLCVLRELTGKYFLIAVLLYSAGLRLEECLRIRVKDIDFELRQILVRDGKGAEGSVRSTRPPRSGPAPRSKKARSRAA